MITYQEFYTLYIQKHISLEKIAQLYGISKRRAGAIKRQYGFLGRTGYIAPTREEIIEEYINKNKTIQQLADKYHCGYGRMFRWIKEQNIKKPTELLYRENPILQYSYKKGHVPHNKGIHEMTSPNCAKTFWTRERIMERTEYCVPRIGKGDHLVVADPTEPRKACKNTHNGKVYHAVRRIPYARYVLKQAGIEVPKGQVVWHIDGDYTNNDIGNLEIISRGEAMKRNHMLGLKKKISTKCE